MDICTTFSPETLECDWGLDIDSDSSAPLDLTSDTSLRTAILLSLFTDRRANDDDSLPDDTDDRRGWWGDSLPPATAATGWQTGSRLWLLSRAKQTDETARRARDYAEEALVWLTDSGAADAVTVETAWLPASTTSARSGVLTLKVTVDRPSGVPATYDLLWSLV